MELLLELAIAIVLIALYVMTYKGVLKYAELVEEGWQKVEEHLEKHVKLTTRLVDSINSEDKPLLDTLNLVNDALNHAQSASLSSDRQAEIDAHIRLSELIKSVFTYSKSNADLSVAEAFITLKSEILANEKQLAYASRVYNSVTTVYNSKIKSVPAGFVAVLHRIQPKPLISAQPEESNKPQMKLY